MIEISEDGDSIIFPVRVVPRASRSAVLGEHHEAIKVAVSSPPVDGAANAEVIKLFAKSLSVPKGSVEIVSGANSRNKRLRITGITAEQLRQVIA